MITTALVSLAVSLLVAVLDLVPIPGPPSWLAAPSGAVATVFSGAASMGTWFPTTLVLTVIAGVLAIRLSGLGVKIARMVLSLFTGGGGNAGG